MVRMKRSIPVFPLTEGGTYVVRINISVGESHRVIRVIHDLAADPADERGIDMMREWDFSRQDAEIFGTCGTVDIALRMFRVVM